MDRNMGESRKSVQIMTKEGPEEMLKTYPKEKLTKTLIWVCFASSFLSIHYGYFIWIIYSPGVLLRKYYNETSFQVINPRKFQILELAINISIIPLGGIFASVLGGFLADNLGRKGSLGVGNIIALTSAILMAGKTFIQDIEFAFLTHFFSGLSAGLILCVVPLYLGEIAPRKYRGGTVFIHQLFSNIGILISQILAIKEFLGNKSGWPALMGMAGILPLVQMFLLPWIPESPRYLMILKKDEDQARKVLQRLREKVDVEDEIEEMIQEDYAESNNKDMTPLKLIRTLGLRFQIITLIVIVAGSQLNGVSLAYFSTERIFLMTPIHSSNLKFLTSGSTLFMICLLLIVIYLVDIVGRRPILLCSFAICIIISVSLIILLEVQKTVKVLSYFSSILLILFICAQDVIAAHLPSLLTVELFSQSPRASAFAIAGTVYWSIGFITGITFYFLERQLGNFSCAIFLPFSLGTLTFIYKIVPETKSQTYPEIKRKMSLKKPRRFRSRTLRKKSSIKRHS